MHMTRRLFAKSKDIRNDSLESPIMSKGSLESNLSRVDYPL